MIAMKSQLLNQFGCRHITHDEATYLYTNSVVGYRTNHDVIRMSLCFRMIFTIHHDKLGPFLRIIFKYPYIQASTFSLILVKFKT